jgi:hypothetical protein
MKKNLRYWAGVVFGAAIAVGFTSCAYDPYYSSTSISGSYSSGYGDGYGYGGSGFSTSVFIGTGDPRWGYDPYTYSYYDYHRRCYYDPYLNGYYPIGYRPPVVYGVPHPYGWRGHGHIHPPGRIYSSTLGNYRNREYAYRNSNYGWAKQVRQRPVEQGRTQGSRPSQSSYDRRGSQTQGSRPTRDSYDQERSRSSGSRYESGSRPSSSYYREGQNKYQGNQSPRTSSRSSSGQETRGRLPSQYNSPVNSPSPRTSKYQHSGRTEAPRSSHKSERAPKEKNSDNDKDRVRGYR